MSSEPLVARLFQDMGRRMSRKARNHVNDLCEGMNLPPNTWYRWWLETRPTGDCYDNIVTSPKTDAEFSSWVEGERMYAARRVAAQAEALKIALRDGFLNPDEELRRPIRGVGPLVHFTLGRYLGCPPDVAWLEERAVDELSAKPWLAAVLMKYSEFLPEPVIVSEHLNTTGIGRCQQETKRTTWSRRR